MELEVAYTLDASDLIIDVNDAWIAFASANDGIALLPPAILGRSLWDYIVDRTTTLVYQRLFERIRAGIGPVRFAFRCDGPAVRRLLEMSIVMQAAGALSFVVRPLRVEERAPLRLLDPDETRSDAVLVVCSWCNRILDGNGGWIEIEVALSRMDLFQQSSPPVLSHGMCDDCHRAMTEALDDPQRAASGSISLGRLAADSQ